MRLVLALFAAALALNAQSGHRSGNTLFFLPEGWTRVDRGGTAILTAPQPRGAPPVRITIAPTTQLGSMEIRYAFEQVMRKANTGLQVIGGGKIEPRESKEGYEVLVTQIEALTGRAEGAHRFYMASKPGERFELVTYMAPTEELFRQYLPAFDQFCATMTYINLRKLPAK
jgi:hypothetical protein